jgi:hypothetical protein
VYLNKSYYYKQAVLYICLLSPLLFSMVRKILPGQPAWVEIPPLICIFFLFIFSLHKMSFPRLITRPLIVIILIYIIFITFSILVDYRVGLTSFFTRITPIFLVFIFYKYIINIYQIRNISKVFSWISLLLLPIALLGILHGNSFLYEIFSPIESVILGGRELRHGYSSISTIFTTPWTMAWSMVGFIGLLGFSITTFRHSSYEKLLIHIGLISCLILLFLTMRRGALAVGILCYVYIYFNNFDIKRILLWLVMSSLFIVVLIFLDFSVVSNKKMSMSEAILRSEDISLYHRFKLIFWNTYMFYMELYPFGSFLGAAGAEGRAFGIDLSDVHQWAVEVGGAQMVIELGIFPHLLFFASLLSILYIQYYCSRGTPVTKGVRVLLLMQAGMIFMWYFKSMLVLTNPHFGLFFFWASVGISMAAISNSKNTKLLDNKKYKKA